VLYQDDDSMTCADGGISLPIWTEYIIDIDRKAGVGDFVLVPGKDRAYLRQLVEDFDGPKWRPNNPQFQTVPATGEVIGVVVEAKRRIYRAQI
jgi:hypothetical protein